MRNEEMMLALVVAVFVMLVAIFMRQGELMLAMRRVLARTEGLAGEEERRLELQISELVGESRTSEAIRLYRTTYGASLVDASAAVDKIARGGLGG